MPLDSDDTQCEALVAVGVWLKSCGYQFTAVTPATHAGVNSRLASAEACSVCDVFGWSRPFAPAMLPKEVLHAMQYAGLLESSAGLLRSKVRFSSLGAHLFARSA